jgi:hypothetical protein
MAPGQPLLIPVDYTLAVGVMVPLAFEPGRAPAARQDTAADVSGPVGIPRSVQLRLPDRWSRHDAAAHHAAQGPKDEFAYRPSKLIGAIVAPAVLRILA